jgi:hypothetical protein
MSAQTELITSTSQNFLDIFDITNNMVIMKDGTASVMLTVNAMNFGLLAEEEQDSIIYAYAALLNSLNYTVQIVIQSQTKDVTSYLSKLKDREEKASSVTKRKMISRYRGFLNDLIRERNVLDKKFYIIIPATALELGIIAATSVLPGSAKFDISTIDKSMLLEKAKNLLEPKIDHLISQFNRLGLIAKQLSTQEIIKIFYNSYNPKASEGQEITDSRSYTTPLVEANVVTHDLIKKQPNQAAQPVQFNQASQTTQSVQPAPPIQAAQPVQTAQTSSGVGSRQTQLQAAQQIQKKPNQQPIKQTQSTKAQISQNQQPIPAETVLQPLPEI